MRVEKRFTLPRAQTATVSLNIYNAFNSNTVTALQNRSGASSCSRWRSCHRAWRRSASRIVFRRELDARGVL
jgi:hypothetical protein